MSAIRMLPIDFFDEHTAYVCKLCKYTTIDEDDFVDHILEEHFDEAMATGAVKPTGPCHFDANSIALAEAFST